MGGRSSSSSASTNSTTTNVNDHRVAVEAGGFGVGSHSSVNYNDTEVLVEGFGSLREISKDALQLYAGYGEGITKLASDVISENNAILAEGIEDNAKEIAESAIKYLVIGGVVVATAALLRN